jgi:hypothetical protein
MKVRSKKEELRSIPFVASLLDVEDYGQFVTFPAQLDQCDARGDARLRAS